MFLIILPNTSLTISVVSCWLLVDGIVMVVCEVKGFGEMVKEELSSISLSAQLRLRIVNKKNPARVKLCRIFLLGIYFNGIFVIEKNSPPCPSPNERGGGGECK